MRYYRRYGHPIAQQVKAMLRLAGLNEQKSPLGISLLLGGSYVTGEVLTEESYWSRFTREITGGKLDIEQSPTQAQSPEAREDPDCQEEELPLFLRLGSVKIRIGQELVVSQSLMSVSWGQIEGFQFYIGVPQESASL